MEEKKTFEEISIARFANEEVHLKTLSEDGKTDSEFFIVPMKFDRDIANRVRQLCVKIMRSYNIEPDPERTDEESRKLMAAKAKVGKIEGNDKTEEEIAKLAFTKGVYKHNLDYRVHPEDSKNTETAFYNFKDEKVFELFKQGKFDIVLQEITQIVNDYNQKLERLLIKDKGKKNENSATQSNGDSEEQSSDEE
jgi:cytochrome oxidase Cu insertion factor (SCO1/SenC/PrrC family)